MHYLFQKRFKDIQRALKYQYDAVHKTRVNVFEKLARRWALSKGNLMIQISETGEERALKSQVICWPYFKLFTKLFREK